MSVERIIIANTSTVTSPIGDYSSGITSSAFIFLEPGLTIFRWDGGSCLDLNENLEHVVVVTDSINHRLASPESRGPQVHIFHNNFFFFRSREWGRGLQGRINACYIVYFTVNGSKLPLEVKDCLWPKMDIFLHCDNKMRSPENELLFLFSLYKYII